MPKKQEIEHPILKRIYDVKKDWVTEDDLNNAPTDPDLFLEWWWNTKASICDSCILSKGRTTVVKPDGLASAEIMILGEGPGFIEDLSGVPLAGIMELRGSRCGQCLNSNICYSHRILQKPTDYGKKKKSVTCNPNFVSHHTLSKNNIYLRSVGSIIDGLLINSYGFSYPRHNWIVEYNKNNPTEPWQHKSPFFFSNAVLCRSTDSTRLKDEAPPSAAKSSCKYHLIHQWAAVNPKIIICLGREVLSMFVGGDTKAASVVPNELIETKLGPVIFNFHPAAMMRDPAAYSKGIEFSKLKKTFDLALEFVGYPVD